MRLPHFVVVSSFFLVPACGEGSGTGGSLQFSGTEGEEESADESSGSGGSGNTSDSSASSGDGDAGDGDGSSGDGDGSSGDGDGSGGDGDGSGGDGDGSSGDGDGSSSGDGDGTSGDGDGTSGDGDGTSGDGDGTSGDGDGTSGDGDGTSSGDGDGTASGDGDGTSGDGDGTSGDGDGTSGDGDGASGDGDGTGGDGDGDGTPCLDACAAAEAPCLTTCADDQVTCEAGCGNMGCINQCGNTRLLCDQSCNSDRALCESMCGGGTSGDGDGDGTTGDGDGTATGDGDGTATGDGDGTATGDGDGTATGDGDGTTSAGDGDGTTTAGDGDGTTGDGDGDGTTGTSGCFVVTNPFERLVPKVVLALDKSGSMFASEWSPSGANCPGAGDCETRWATLHGVVDQVTTQFQDTIALGTHLFPRKGTGGWGYTACAVNNINWQTPLPGPQTGNPNGGIDVPTGPTNAMPIMTYLPLASTTSSDSNGAGATPTHDGLNASYEHLRQEVQADPTTSPFVILITDGAANCNWEDNDPSTIPGGNDIMHTYDNRLSNLVSNAFTGDGIPTFVVGIDMAQNELTCESGLQFCRDPWKEQGSGTAVSEIEPYQKLNDLAIDGGRPKGGTEKFYSASDPAALFDELDLIISGLQSCVIPLDPVPPFPDNIQVDLGASIDIPEVTDCAIENGWVYVDPTCAPGNSAACDAIELCGTFCDDLLAAPMITADVTYFCVAG